MNSLTNLMTVYKFRGKEYLVSLNTVKHRSGTIEVKITDKKTLEEWHGLYDAAYIENLTQKTGNFKRFDTFLSMLKSGLLTTSQCVSLDLLTLEDLEMLRNRVSSQGITTSHSQGFTASHSSQMFSSSNNKRYLIVTYTVEFDRIHYPLALEYSGQPDPKILQENIQRLEKQVAFLENQLNCNNLEDITNQIDSLQKKVVDVTTENVILKEQIKKLSSVQVGKYTRKEMDMLFKSVYSLESKLKGEREIVDKLRREKSQLSVQLEEALKTERFLKSQLRIFQFEQPARRRQNPTAQSPSPTRNRSLNQCLEKPFHPKRETERKVWSASSPELGRSSSEDSYVRKRGKANLKKRCQFNTSPRVRASSPTFSELSHNSGLSRCGCRNCLDTKFLRPENQSKQYKDLKKCHDREKLMKRIQSLENLISSIVLN
uniref:Coiled-coil domain-containing protein 61 n=1 Tax=Graphocephala atropunctata TaxID=36148 RepID=A0A1B6LFW0_9HEMI